MFSIRRRFAFLFGSDKFNDSTIGRLAVATSASIGDSPKVSLVDARELQKRRVLRLALKEASKLEPWVAGDFDVCIWWKVALIPLGIVTFPKKGATKSFF